MCNIYIDKYVYIRAYIDQVIAQRSLLYMAYTVKINKGQ